MSPAATKNARMVLGGSPRAHLLPPEVGDRKRGASIRRAVVMSVIGAVVVCGVGYAFASYLAIDAAGRYDEARAETSALLEEQGKYSDLRTLADLQQTLTDARQVGALTEVNWQAFYGRLTPTLPAGVTLSSFVIDAGSPIEDPAVSAVPGTGVGIAKVTMVANTTNLAAVETWVTTLKALPEYGGSIIRSVARDDAGQLTVSMDLTLTDVALSNRFQPEPEPATDTTTDAATEEATN